MITFFLEANVVLDTPIAEGDEDDEEASPAADSTGGSHRILADTTWTRQRKCWGWRRRWRAGWGPGSLSEVYGVWHFWTLCSLRCLRIPHLGPCFDLLKSSRSWTYASRSLQEFANALQVNTAVLLASLGASEGGQRYTTHFMTWWTAVSSCQMYSFSLTQLVISLVSGPWDSAGEQCGC